MTPEQLAAKFAAAKAAMTGRKVAAMKRIVLRIERYSKMETPVRYGHLRRSETSRVDADGNRGAVGTNLRYARYVHDGTRRMAARPYFTRGAQRARPEIDGDLKTLGAEIVDNLGGV